MTRILQDPRERTRFLRFAAVGAIGTLVDFGAMNVLVLLGRFSLVMGGTLSFILAVLNNFTWNRFWTYPESRSKPVIGQLAQFGIVNAIGMAIRLPILQLGEPAFDSFLVTLPIQYSLVSHEFISHNVTLGAAIGIVMLWNFFVNRYWTYNDIQE